MNYNFATQTEAEVFDELNSSVEGLSEKEVKKRQIKHGPNELKSDRMTPFKILLRQLRSPFIYLLLFAAFIAILMGEIVDGILVVVFVLINTILSFVQEYHSERTLIFLKKYIKANAKVRRNGVETLIDTRDLVPGDLLIVETGDVVPADIRLIEINNLSVDESVITGESVPINKKVVALKKLPQSAIGCDNIVFSATTITSGKGIGIVISIGSSALIGEMARLTTETKRVSTFEKGISHFSSFILRMISFIVVLLFITNILIKGDNTNFPELVLFCVALTVGVIPEALPVVTTLSFSRGAIRLARRKVVVRRLSAVEDLGSIEVLCTDKTGTITENSLKVFKLNAKNKNHCLRGAALAASFLGEGESEPNNAFDIAIWGAVSKQIKGYVKRSRRIFELPFDPKRRHNSVLVENGGKQWIIVRGAPESILPLCLGLNENQITQLNNWLINEGQNGRRVIAVAEKETRSIKSYKIADEKNVKFIGFISFNDPIKKTTRSAISQANKLNVQVKILTGDSKEVAGAVAKEIGLIADSNDVITGDELMSMTLIKRQAAVERYAVFARVTPEQKHKIIALLQKKYEVGFLGEGINDAPALKLANVALAVNGASDIAREASDIILLNPSLSVIIEGIKCGREIFANTVKYLKITLISNFGNFYAIAIASLIIAYLPMLPVQILLLNLLSDFPMIAIAMDTVDRSELRRPRTYNIREVVLMAIILGLVSTVFDFIFFALFINREPAILQTGWFIGSVVTELALIYSIRTRVVFWRAKFPSFILLFLSISAIAVAVILPFTSFGQELFRFAVLRVGDFIMIGIVMVAYFVCTEIIKRQYYRKVEENNGFNHNTA